MFKGRRARRPGSGTTRACEQLELRQFLTISPLVAPIAWNETPAIAVALEATVEAVALAQAAPAAVAESLSSAPAMPSMAHTLPESGVLVTDTQIIAGHDTLPRFTANPTVTAVASGAWSDPRIWSTGRVPVANDRVQIGPGRSITYGIVSAMSLDNMEIGGRLSFATGINTSLKVGTLTVLPGGVLEIGTPQSPIAVGVKAELIIADRPLAVGTLAQPGIDPAQYGTGLLVFGTFTTHGATASAMWTRLAAEPRAGDTYLQLSEAVTGWRSGSTIVLPDSRQVKSSQDWQFQNGVIPPQWETAVIDSVVGTRVNLKQPLAFDHLGARNTSGALELLPHVGLLERNVVIRSENPNGTRGHTFYSASATVDIEYTRFADLGRTDALRGLDSTTKDAQGRVTHLGANQVGRYAVHLHHLFGPPNATNTGFQYRFVGNTVDGFKKWGVAIHDSNFGLLDENVIYNGQGAGLVTEEGQELYNTITNNFALRIQGTGSDGKDGTQDGDYGRGGVGFWFRRSGNEISGNVAADTNYAGFVFSSYYDLAPIDAALARGFNPDVEGQSVPLANNPAGTFLDNESYGMTASGLWAAYITGPNLPTSPQFTFRDLRIWHTNTQPGVVIYHTANTVFDGMLVLGDQAAQDRPDTGSVGIAADNYENINLVIRNSRIEGFRIGIVAPTAGGGSAVQDMPTIVRDSLLRNYINIVVQLKPDRLAAPGNSLDIRNVRFGSVVAPARTAEFSGPALNVKMHFALTDNGEPANVVAPSVARVYDYNQIPGNDFQVFYLEQDPSFVIPKTSASALSGRGSALIGAPQAGLTNQTAMSTLGIAVAGRVSPTRDSTSHPEIHGYTAPILSATTTPRVALLTPWENAVVQGNSPVRVRYIVTGDRPAGSVVFFQLDGGARFTSFTDGGLYGMRSGSHTLRAYLGDPRTGGKIPGTIETMVTFRVQVPISVAIQGATGFSGEGAPISLTSSTTGLSGELSYQWSVTKNGQPYPATNHNNPSFVFTPDDNGTYAVSLTVKDGNNNTGAASTSMLVSNRAPAVSSANLSHTSVNEGSSVMVSGTVADSGAADTLSVAIDWGDGSLPAVTAVDPLTRKYSASHRYVDDPPNSAASDNFTISLTAIDDEQTASAAVRRSVTVRNVVPVPVIVSVPLGAVVDGTPIGLSSMVLDMGNRDVLAYAWTVTKNNVNYPVANNFASNFSFTPMGSGAYVVKLTVSDDDGGVGASTASILVVNFFPASLAAAIDPQVASCSVSTAGVRVATAAPSPSLAIGSAAADVAKTTWQFQPPGNAADSKSIARQMLFGRHGDLPAYQRAKLPSRELVDHELIDLIGPQ